MMDPYVPTLSAAAKRWIRFVGLLAGGILVLAVTYRLRSVLTPLAIAAALAYVLNPIVTWFESVRRVPRLTTVIVAFTLAGVLLIGGGIYVVSHTITQLAELQEKVPRYVQMIGSWAEKRGHSAFLPEKAPFSGKKAECPLFSAPTSAPASATRPASWWNWMEPLLKEHGAAAARTGLDYVASAASSVANLVSLLVLVPVFMFYFLWRFNDFVRVLHDHLPAAYRATIVHLVKTTDAAVANFFRGRLIVCWMVGTLLGLGWSLVGVPYSLPLGLLGGVLNLVPFLSVLVLPPALLFAYLGASEAGTSWLWPVLLAMGVFMAVQALESFLLSPTIESHTSGLHPLIIVVVLLIGGELAGLLGMLLAIPLASTLKTLATEWLLPEVRRLAGR